MICNEVNWTSMKRKIKREMSRILFCKECCTARFTLISIDVSAIMRWKMMKIREWICFGKKRTQIHRVKFIQLAWQKRNVSKFLFPPIWSNALSLSIFHTGIRFFFFLAINKWMETKILGLGHTNTHRNSSGHLKFFHINWNKNHTSHTHTYIYTKLTI